MQASSKTRTLPAAMLLMHGGASPPHGAGLEAGTCSPAVLQAVWKKGLSKGISRPSHRKQRQGRGGQSCHEAWLGGVRTNFTCFTYHWFSMAPCEAKYQTTCIFGASMRLGFVVDEVPLLKVGQGLNVRDACRILWGGGRSSTVDCNSSYQAVSLLAVT
jgi:hypothetical protein